MTLSLFLTVLCTNNRNFRLLRSLAAIFMQRRKNPKRFEKRVIANRQKMVNFFWLCNF